MSRVFDAYFFSPDYERDESQKEIEFRRRENEWWEWQEHEAQKEEDLYTYQILTPCQQPSTPITD